jgi:hypothetical protein
MVGYKASVNKQACQLPLLAVGDMCNNQYSMRTGTVPPPPPPHTHTQNHEHPLSTHKHEHKVRDTPRSSDATV